MRLSSLFGGVVAIAVIVSFAAQARAGLVYDNGSPTATPWGSLGSPYNVSPPLFQNYWTSNSFTLAAATTLTNAQIALWTQYPPPSSLALSSVQWYLGTESFDSSIGSGTSTLTYTDQNTSYSGDDLYEAAFSLGTPISLAPGTYWLTLTDPNANTNTAYWAESSNQSLGSSADSYDGSNPPPGGSYPLPWGAGAESFQLYDNQSQVTPEPTSLLIWSLLGLGALSLHLRRRSAKA